MRADIEEAKTQENAKLQSAFQEMQLQFKETKELLAKEREAAQKASEVAPIIQEVPVIDHEMISKLTAENEQLKALVNSLEKKIDETEKKFEESFKLSFSGNEDWRELEEAVQSGPISGFGKKLSSVLGTCLSEYDTEATYFDEGVRSAKRKQLEEKLLQLVQPAFQDLLGHLRSGTLDKFKEAFDKALDSGEGFAAAARECTQSYMALFDDRCADAIIEQANWDTSKVREKLRRDIDAHVSSVREAKLSELTSLYEAQLKEALSEPVEALLDGANNETWPSIRKLLRRETESAVSGLSSALSGFEMYEETKTKMLARLEDYARGVVEAKAKEEAARVLMRMKDRFTTMFSHDSDSMPRVWTGKEDIRAITKTARSSSLKLLSVMAVIRLDDNEDDAIENTLTVALVDSTSGAVKDRSITTGDPLASSTWEKVPSSKTLLTPVHCKSLWRQFKTETEYTVSQAIAAQEANKRNNNWLPPPWAIVALIVLGFNEFMTLLRNPFYLGVIFVAFLLVKALWVQLDISGEFRNGALPGLLSLSTKFLPTVMNIIRKLAEEGNAPAANDSQRNPASASKSFQNGGNTTSEASSTGSSEITQNDQSSSSKQD